MKHVIKYHLPERISGVLDALRSPISREIFEYLMRYNHAEPKRIVRDLGIDRSTLTTHLNSLEEGRLIVKEIDRQDGSTEIFPTHAGKCLYLLLAR